MRPGDKVLCVVAIPKDSRRFLKPVPKPGWVYLVENTMTIKSSDGEPCCAIKIAGVENLKDTDGQPVYLAADYFIPLNALAAANQLRKQKYP